MSGKGPRMGWNKKFFVPDSILCSLCGPVYGYGWDVPEEYHFYKWRTKKVASLPPAGNGYPINGICKNCCGTGIMPIPLSEVY